MLIAKQALSYNAYACVDSDTNYPVAFFTLAASTSKVPGKFHVQGKDLNWEHYPSIQIDYLFVDKELQHNGIGSYVIDWVKLEARKRCCNFESYRYLILNAIKTEQAIRFYKKKGFLFSDEADEEEIEQSLEDGLFLDDKDKVVGMFFDLMTLTLQE